MIKSTCNFKKLATLFLLLLLLVGCSSAPKYDTVEVEAPFAMEPIKLFRFPNKAFPITQYGAEQGDVEKNSVAIAKAITACHGAGGGRVVIPKGEWLTGPIHFKSNVNLHLEEGAVLLFSDNVERYLPAVMTSWEGMECYNYSPLIYAFECDNIAISGPGLLKAKIDFWRNWFPRPQAHLEGIKELYTLASTDVPVVERQMAKGEVNMRPHFIHFNRCKNILLEQFSLINSPFWTIHLYMCDGGVMRDLNVSAHGHNSDGVDLEMSRNFLVENCTFDQGDDAVVIKAGRNQDAWRLNTPSENIVIRNCHILAGHTLLGIGSEMSGGVRNVYMHNCVAPNNVHRLFYLKTNHRRGGFIHNIYMDTIEVSEALSIFEIDTDVLYQWRTLVPTYEERVTDIAGIHLSNLSCKAAKRICHINGDERLPVRDVTVKNVHVGVIADSVRSIINAQRVSFDQVTYDSLDSTILPHLDRYLSNR